VSTTPAEIERLLSSGGFRASTTAEGTILTGFGEMESYRDAEGLPRLVILISLEEGGSLVRITCPRLYSYTGVRFKADLFQTCLMLNYWVKLIQMQFDDRDGELRAAVELPIEDAPLTLPQLARCLTDLAHFVDRFDPMIRRTLKVGGVHIPRDAVSYQRR
jgi:hypothetical protein